MGPVKQTEAEVEEIRRRGVRRVVGRRALREIGRLVAEDEREERVRRQLVRRLWLPLVVAILVAAAVFLLYRILPPA